jgi:hypothetical protein
VQFPPAGLPPVDAFWSLAGYTAQDMNLIPNDADRYSVGDRTPGLHPDPEQPWFLILRLYRPHAQVITAEWKCPGIRRVP